MPDVTEFPYLPHEDAVSTPFWEGTRNRKLLLQWCMQCQVFQWYPRAICISCAGDTLQWRPASGKGIVDSWTRVHRPPSEGFVPPYVIARVLLDENVLMLTRLVGELGDNPSCDAEVTLKWQELSDGRALPVFE